ncbi:hypothetical protein BLS_002915 [Venturia inaequalis]|uniref:Uncharacterized protein n=1 Tax=Venturia inaequalis TaxID=5025 RepID=A0A8H3UBC5_VENIN|nr:hypothetical protein BLS_002915 [Venturia inaequalis]KAE9966845.1 hypothetical protein EG328_008599 [Venturia inaequalis]KAE9983132.1 hypothetical protein EG327_005600 [Venturia inaequalis]RDI76438.1 Pre-mRNA-processing protein 45 [Venturia inaequalis]
MSSEAYDVYRVEYKVALQDPLMGPGTRYHNGIFVHTEPDVETEKGGGQLFSVKGAIGDSIGMEFEQKPARWPEESSTFRAKHYIGQIRKSDYDTFRQLLASVPPPPRQRCFNTSTRGWEPCKPDGSFYAPYETPPPYMKCTEWVLLKAIPALQQMPNLLYPNGVPAQPQSQQVFQTAIQQATQPAAEQASQGASAWVWDTAQSRYRYWNGTEWIWQT